jgi:hypothetical protein
MWRRRALRDFLGEVEWCEVERDLHEAVLDLKPIPVAQPGRGDRTKSTEYKSAFPRQPLSTLPFNPT